MASICKRRLAAPDIERKLEARIGIEPMHKDFADPRLTTWLPRHSSRGKDSGGWAGCQPGRGGENRVDGTPMVVIHPSGLIASGRGVAQTGSAFAWGAKGPGFKSRRPDHIFRANFHPTDGSGAAFSGGSLPGRFGHQYMLHICIMMTQRIHYRTHRLKSVHFRIMGFRFSSC